MLRNHSKKCRRNDSLNLCTNSSNNPTKDLFALHCKHSEPQYALFKETAEAFEGHAKAKAVLLGGKVLLIALLNFEDQSLVNIQTNLHLSSTFEALTSSQKLSAYLFYFIRSR